MGTMVWKICGRGDGKRFLLYVLLLTLLLGLLGSGGCRGGGRSIQTGDVSALATDAILQVLIGLPEEQRATRPQADLGLLRDGKYRAVMIAADGPAFAEVSRRALTVGQIQKIEEEVIARVARELKSSGYRVERVDFPPQTTEPRTLTIALTPATREVGSPSERARNEGKTLVFVQMTVRDAASGEVLAVREFYSGEDAARNR
ncbi:MAG: hypothetical protein OHK0029_15660 [Armatimonadaceae bacterium]